MPILEPAAEFRHLSKEEVQSALADPDPNNAIAAEVTRLVVGYAQNFKAHCERLGFVPVSFVTRTPDTAIEAVAIRLVTEAIRQEIVKP